MPWGVGDCEIFATVVDVRFVVAFVRCPVPVRRPGEPLDRGR